MCKSHSNEIQFYSKTWNVSVNHITWFKSLQSRTEKRGFRALDVNYTSAVLVLDVWICDIQLP